MINILNRIDYELKKSNRFLIKFIYDLKIESMMVDSISKPKYINGKWSDIEITFIDPIGPSTSQILFDFINKTKKYNFFNKKILNFEISTLDPTGMIVEIWEISVSEIKSIDFGDLNINNQQPTNISMILKPNKCNLKY